MSNIQKFFNNELNIQIVVKSQPKKDPPAPALTNHFTQSPPNCREAQMMDKYFSKWRREWMPFLNQPAPLGEVIKMLKHGYKMRRHTEGTDTGLVISIGEDGKISFN